MTSQSTVEFRGVPQRVIERIFNEMELANYELKVLKKPEPKLAAKRKGEFDSDATAIFRWDEDAKTLTISISNSDGKRPDFLYSLLQRYLVHLFGRMIPSFPALAVVV